MVSINNGHDTAELVRNAGPDGNTVLQAINRTQTAFDRLHDANLIHRYQWQACCDLKSLWDKARPIPDVAALDHSRVGGSQTDIEINPEADRRLRGLSRALGTPCWVILERLIVDDTDPRDWGNETYPTGLQFTQHALEALAKEMGLA